MRMLERLLPGLNWGITTTFVLFQFFIQATTGLMANRWANDFGISPAEVGNLSAAFFYAYVSLQIPVGIAFDLFGVRKIIISASVLLTLGCFMMALASSYYVALMARLLMGAGSAFGFVGMLYITAAWFTPKQFAVLVGIAETTAMAGVALGEVGMASLITQHGWRYSMHLSGFVALLITLLSILFIRDKNPPQKSSHDSQFKMSQSIKYALSNRQVWLAGLYGFSLMAIINVFGSLWGVPFLRDTYPWLSLYGSASLVSMVFLGVAIGGPLTAWLSNYVNKRKIIMLSMGVVNTLLSLLFFLMSSATLLFLYIALLLLGLSASAYILTFALTKETVDEKYRATCLSAMNMILMASGPILQPFIGFLLHHGFSYKQAMLILPAIASLTLIGFIFIKDSITNSNTASA